MFPFKLKRELLLKFVGGELDIKNPSCRYRGEIDDIDPMTNGQDVALFMVHFRWLVRKEGERLIPGSNAVQEGREFWMPFHIKKLLHTKEDKLVLENTENETLTFFAATSGELDRRKFLDNIG